ncbi:MAG: DUF1501 domain-containing protein, partial [Myxococcaceae bacterium]
GIAEAVAQTITEPRFLIYWFQEGGWDGYCMFNPVDTTNDATRVIPAGTLNPSPSWSAHRYRPINYGNTAAVFRPKTQGNIPYGHLANDGLSLFPDLAVVASHYGNTFHSGGRWDYHYGKYNHSLSATRAPDERTVLQAFCEQYGQSFLLPHISWHRWLSDGELSTPSYPEGTGYYEKLGPAWAHTIYGKTPADLRSRLLAISNISAGARDARIRQFTDNLHSNFIKDKNSQAVAAFASAVQIHKASLGNTTPISPNQLFNSAALRSEFNVQPGDENTDSTSVNGNPARSKETPNTNVQAMMTYELMTQGISCGFFIESRDIRGFDTHRNRSSIMAAGGQSDQLNDMKKNLWQPLTTLVNKLKNTPYGSSGKSYWDLTTIVLASEMGRTLQGDVDSILSGSDTDSVKYQAIMDQDCCQHWKVSSVAFLGGTVQGNRSYGRVGTSSLDAIPIMPDGTLDPAYDPVTGVLKSGATKSPNSYISDCGNVYATALALTGINPTGKGKNTSPAMDFIKKP